MIKAKSMFPYLRALLFLVIAAAVFNTVSLVCKSASWGGNNDNAWFAYRNILDMKDIPTDNSIDVAFFGGSTAQYGISPMTIFGEHGIRAQNLGGVYIDFFPSHLIMQEFTRKHPVKVVFLEVTHLFVGFPYHEKALRMVGDGLPFSPDKITVIDELFNEYGKTAATDSQISYIVPLIKHRNAWKNLNKRGLEPFVEADNPQYYHGSPMINTLLLQSPQEWSSFRGWTDTGEQLAELSEPQYEHFTKIVELCRERNIKLVLFKTFMADRKAWTPEKHNAAQKVANEMDLPFFDFHMQNLMLETGFDYVRDPSDTLHINRFGAEKISRYLGRYLRDNFDLPDRRGDPEYAYMNDDLIKYKREMSLANFSIEGDVSRYLDLLRTAEANNYTVIFSLRDTHKKNISDEVLGKMRAFGFVADNIFKDPWHSFIGIWQDGKVIYEAGSKTFKNPDTDILEYRSVLPDGMKYYVKTASTFVGNVSNIVINGVDYSKNRRGFNIVVYDNATGRVIDSSSWDTYVDAGITR